MTISSIRWRIPVRETYWKVALPSDYNIHTRRKAMKYRILVSCDINRHKRAKMEYCYSWTEGSFVEFNILTFVINGNVWSWPSSRSKEINLGKKQKYCFKSCLWSYNTFEPGYSKPLGCLWTEHHVYASMYNLYMKLNEVPIASFPSRTKTMNRASWE